MAPTATAVHGLPNVYERNLVGSVDRYQIDA